MFRIKEKIVTFVVGFDWYFIGIGSPCITRSYDASA